MPTYKEGLSPKIREMVTQINKVGIANLMRYCKTHHPKFDFDLAIYRIRKVAQLGYRYASYQCDVTEERLCATLKQCYKFAKELEERVAKLDGGG